MHQPNSSLYMCYVYRAPFPRTPAMKRRAFCVGNTVDNSLALRVAARSWDAFTSISVKDSFRWACLTRDERLWVGTIRSTRTFQTGGWWKSKFFESQLGKNPGERPDGSPVASIGLRSGVHSRILGSALSTSFHFCCARRYHSWWALLSFSFPKAPLRKAEICHWALEFYV